MPSVKQQRKLTETGISKACQDLLSAEGIPFLRCNAGDRFGTYKGKTWRIRGHEKGTADLLALPNDEIVLVSQDGTAHFKYVSVVWLEIKLPGKKQSAEQKDFQQRMENRGHVYLVITDVSQLQDWLKQNGAR